jgi:hypothetical protein
MLRTLLAGTALAIGLTSQAHATVFGIFGNDTSPTAISTAAADVTAQGFTPVVLANLTAPSLTGLNVLWILNGDNGAQPPQLLANQVAITSFVSGGGVLVYNDRNVTDAASDVPGGSTIIFIRSLGTDIDVQNNSTKITNGPGGIITNSTLDGGNFSDHGFMLEVTLPAGATAVLNNGIVGDIVDGFYPLGSGEVYYSTIPLDFYLGGAGTNPNFNTIYAPNLIAEAALLAVPEPTSMALLGVGLTILVATRRRRR